MQSKVLSVTGLSDSAFVLRLERHGLEFKAGQYLVLGFPGERISREYSIYSSEHDPFIELLVKEVDPGELSPRLKHLMPGDLLELSGPFGFFILSDQVIHDRQPVVFVATGTGISPFRSFILSYPDIEYTLLHGIRHHSETYHMDDYDPARYIACLSRDAGKGYKGRVTVYLSQNDMNTNAFYYLCGNSVMIDDVMDILEARGVAPGQIKTEVFF